MPTPPGQLRRAGAESRSAFRSVLAAIPAPKAAGTQMDTIAERGEATAVNTEMKEGTV
jgi:hypothetical protein